MIIATMPTYQNAKMPKRQNAKWPKANMPKPQNVKIRRPSPSGRGVMRLSLQSNPLNQITGHHLISLLISATALARRRVWAVVQ